MEKGWATSLRNYGYIMTVESYSSEELKFPVSIGEHLCKSNYSDKIFAMKLIVFNTRRISSECSQENKHEEGDSLSWRQSGTVRRTLSFSEYWKLFLWVYYFLQGAPMYCASHCNPNTSTSIESHLIGSLCSLVKSMECWHMYSALHVK